MKENPASLPLDDSGFPISINTQRRSIMASQHHVPAPTRTIFSAVVIQAMKKTRGESGPPQEPERSGEEPSVRRNKLAEEYG
jgi:hypothetical protein